MLKRFCGGTSPLELVEEREALFYLLPQTTPERLAKNLTGYTIDPKTRYPNLNELVPPGDVSHLYDTDNPSAKPPSQVYQHKQPPRTQAKDANPPLMKAASVSGALGRPNNKRSRSSEDLSAISESTPVQKKTASPSMRAKEHSSQEASPAEKTHPSFQEKIKMLRAKERPPASNQKSPGSERKKTESQPKKKSTSPKPSIRKTPESPKNKQKGIRRFFDRSRSKSPSPTPSSEDEAKEKENTKQVRVKKVAESPKKQEDAGHRPTGHPLSVAKQAQTGHPQPLPTEAKQKSENEIKTAEDTQPEPATASVADIVKRLDPQQPSSDQPTGKNKKKDKVKKEVKAREKEKQHPKGSKAEGSKEKETESKSGGFLSIFKHKKSYDVSKASSRPAKTSTSPKLRKRKKVGKETLMVQQLSENPPLSLQQRMDRLLEQGVGRVQTDGSELVLSLEELRDLEVSSGLGAEDEEDGQGTHSRSRSPASQSEDGLESEQSNRSRSSTPVDSSGTEERRPRSRASHASTGAATYGTSSRGVSPAEADWRLGVTSGEEDASEEAPEQEREEKPVENGEFEMERTPSVVETVRLLEPLSAAFSYDQMVTRRQAEERKSKEFELAELHRQSTAESSNPLWLARVVQGMGRCLERLRKEQESVLATKTTLQIINTILSNVQLHPSDDTYRRVRVSSQRFNQKVWQFSDAGQFLARAGWVEIGDYIVLPMGQTVDNAKRVLEKHLNIVNQMLWSQQLELPECPGVEKKTQPGVSRRHRTITAAMIARRQSYSSRIVAESLKEVEEEQEAIEAELVRMSSSQGRDRESSPNPCDASQVSEERVEEARTMKAASAARSKWLERQRKESLQQRRDRENKLILESELYDLPQSSLQVPVETTSLVASPSPTHCLSVTPDPRSTSPSSASPSQQEICESQEVEKEGEKEREKEGEKEEEKEGEKEREKEGEKEEEKEGEKEGEKEEEKEGEKEVEKEGDKEVEKEGEKEGEEEEEKAGDDRGGSTNHTSTSPDATSQPTDAQYSTPDSIRQDMIEYERITLKAAAQVRQKWTES